MNYTPEEQFHIFVERASELFATRFAKEQMHTRWQIHGGPEKETRAELAEPEADDLRAFLSIFRQFDELKGEPVYLPRVYRYAIEAFTSAEHIQRLTDAREQYQKLRDGELGWMTLNVGGAIITPRQAAYEWINGQYFHADRAKREAIRALDPAVIAPTHKEQLYAYIREVTRHINYVRDNIVGGLKERLLDFCRCEIGNHS